MTAKPPLIVTLDLDPDGFHFFNSLRKTCFPPERNFIDAHLTLFHALPNESDLVDFIAEVCNTRSPLKLEVQRLVSIGNGVAYKIESPELMKLHQQLKTTWFNVLTNQDRQKLWPHITVQNKVTTAQANNLLQKLKE